MARLQIEFYTDALTGGMRISLQWISQLAGLI
jgi:hypothetical protein